VAAAIGLVIAAIAASIAPSARADTCPNEQLRLENNSQSPPECRAYELVSDGDSGGVGVVPQSAASLLSLGDEGGHVLFTSQVFGEPISLPGLESVESATREASGWTVTPMNPNPGRAFAETIGGNYASADLAKALWAKSSPGGYLRGELQFVFSSADGSLHPASPVLEPILTTSSAANTGVYVVDGGSADLNDYVFHNGGTAGITLLPGESLPASGSRDLYEVSGALGDDPTVRLVNMSATGGQVGGGCGAYLGGYSQFKIATHAVSTNGSVIYFSTRPGEAQSACTEASPVRIFKNEGADDLEEVSSSECTRISPPCTGSGNDVYQGASADGSTVFFTTPRELTDSDLDETDDLYVRTAAPPAGQPELVQASAGEATVNHPTPGAEVLGVLDTAANGARVYFVARGELTETPNAQGESARPGSDNIYVYERDVGHPQGRLAFIATLAPADATLWNATGQAKEVYSLPQREADGTFGDGHLLVFTSVAPLTLDDRNSVADVYRYDAISGQLQCLSCQGHDGTLPVTINARGVQSSPPNYGQQDRVAGESGGTVVVVTREPLLPADQNAAFDGYVWNEGAGLGLVTGGTGDSGIALIGRSSGTPPTPVSISATGQEILFYTEAPIVSADHNSVADLYTARVDGGFSQPVPSPSCESVLACLGEEAAAAATEGTAPSSAVTGPGNQAVPKPARPGKRPHCKGGKVRRRGKCVKNAKHHKHGHHERKRPAMSQHGRRYVGGGK